MSETNLVPVDLSQLPSVQVGTDDQFLELAKSSEFIGRLQLFTKGKAINKGLVKPGSYGIPESDEDFVRNLLLEKQVLVVHGSGFGQAPGTRHFRIVFLPDEPTLARAYAGIAEFIRQRYG